MFRRGVMNSFIYWFLIIKFLACNICIVHTNDRYSNLVDISAVGGTNYSQSVLYTFESDTEKCEQLEKLHESSNVLSLNLVCDDSLLKMTFSSNAVLPNGKNMHPFVLLNITAEVRSPVTRLILRLECLEAPNYDDDYCHNHEEQHRRWGRMIWPCRALTINKPGQIYLPFHFTYPYFRILGYSHYRLNISLEPIHCKSSYIVTIPEETWLHPAIARFYNSETVMSSSVWSPLAYVDMTPEDGIIIGYERGTSLKVKRVNLTLFERSVSSIRFISTTVLLSPTSTYKWSDVMAGNYTAYIYADRADCSLFCDGTDDEMCTVCPNTRIRFTVDRDKIASRHYHQFPKYMAAAACLAVILLICASFSFLFLYSLGRRKGVATRNIYLTEYPSVFLVYTDDCLSHSACMLSLAHCLRKHAAVKVHMDQLDLTAPDVIPISWFTETIAAADHILFVFSEGSQAVLRGEHLIQQNPYPEFFTTAVNYFLTECDMEIKKNVFLPSWKTNARFAFAHMCYSPDSVIPSSLRKASIITFLLPNKFGDLVSWLHGQPPGAEVLNEFDISELESGINEVLAYRADNPAWLTERMQTRVQKDALLITNKIPLQKPRAPLSHEEQIVVSQKLNLELPDSISSGSGGMDDEAKYVLIGSPENLSDSSDSLDCKLKMRELLSMKKRYEDPEQ